MNDEEKILVDCFRYYLDPHQFGVPNLHSDLDYGSLLYYAQIHRAIGSLKFIAKNNPGFWPNQFSKEFTSTRYTYLFHVDNAAKQVEAVVTVLTRSAIPAIVLKGWEYIYTVYEGDYGLRPCNDVDILIQPYNIMAAEKILAEFAYRPTIELWPGFRHRHHNVAHHYQVAGQSGAGFNFGVDLHWGLFNRRYFDQHVDLDALFSRAQPLKIGEANVLRLSAEDHILHACGHLNLHHGGSPELFRYFELAWTIKHADPPVDWSVLTARAAEWKLQIPLRTTLTELDRLFPGTLTAETLASLEQLTPGREEQRIYHLLMKYRDTPFVHVLPWRWTPAHFWRSLCFLFEAFVPGPQFLQHRYGKIRFWPLHYLKRIGNSLKQLLAFSRKQ